MEAALFKSWHRYQYVHARYVSVLHIMSVSIFIYLFIYLIAKM